MSLLSMTAFSTAEVETPETTIRCQIKTLNSRYLEVFTKMPKEFLPFEAEINAKIKSQLERGKVEVLIHVTTLQQNENLPIINEAAVNHYLELQSKLAKICEAKVGRPIKNEPLSMVDMLNLNGVLTSPAQVQKEASSESAQKQLIFSCVEQALKTIILERKREGSAMATALAKLVDSIEADRSYLQGMTANLIEDIYKNYVARLEQLIAKMSEANLPTTKDLNKDRLYLEIGILTDKCDIEEELTRLKAHCEEFLKSFESKDGVGRKLDFLCQEMHREVNTMSSKLVNSDALQATVRMKLAIERLKQQVQNIE